MSLRKVTITKNNFCSNLKDSIVLYEMARDTKNSSQKDMLSRQSILSTCFALEAVANSLLEVLPRIEREESGIDRKPTLFKLAYVVSKSNGNEIDTSSKEYDAMCKLIKLRDSMAHPSVVVKEIEVSTEQGTQGLAFTHTEKDNRSSKRKNYSAKGFLDLDYPPDNLDHKDAKTALNMLVAFLNKYVLEWWGINVEDVEIYFFDMSDMGISGDMRMINMEDAEVLNRNSNLFDIKFISGHKLCPSTNLQDFDVK